MNATLVVAAGAALALLGACSPTAQEPTGEDEPAKTVAAMPADPVAPEPPPMLDGEGNELDPEMADALREKMEEDKAALEEAEDDAT